jgi:hypothetical protein
MNCPCCGAELKMTISVELSKLPQLPADLGDLGSWAPHGEILNGKDIARIKKSNGNAMSGAERTAKHRYKIRAMREGLGINCRGDEINKTLGKKELKK